MWCDCIRGEDTFGRHDTIYGCCSEATTFLSYGVHGFPSCYANFRRTTALRLIAQRHRWECKRLMQVVPVLDNGRAAVATAVSPPGSYVDLRAACATLAMLSNCPQIHNPCNSYRPTPIHTIVPTNLKLTGAMMSKIQFFLIPNAPQPVAPYSHVVEVDGWAFITGQLATDPHDDSLPIPDGIEAQTHKVMDNLTRALEGVGLGLDRVVCVRIFLTNFERDYAAMNRIYESYFAKGRLPARTTIGVTALARDGIVEIDMIARRD